MKKVIIAIALLMVLAACTSGNSSRTDARDFRTQCLDGVEYYVTTETSGYSGYGFMTVKYNRDGTVETC
jgi:uncharacterized lipoprotein